MAPLIASVGTKLMGWVFGLIDKSVEDKDKALEIKSNIQKQILEGDQAELQGAVSIITAEAAGESWLQRNWRPLTMIWFSVLLGLYWFGIMPPNLTQETLERLFSLLQLGIGGYIGGRSLEKIADKLAPMLKRN